MRMMADVELLSAAAKEGHVQRARALLQKETDPNAINSSGNTAIQEMMMGCPEMTQLLLEHGADPNVRDASTGMTPAHHAANEGYIDTLIVLLNGGAHLHIANRWGILPMDLAPHTMVAVLQYMGIVSERGHHIQQETL